MKKLLAIVVLGLLLFSCSNSESDKMKMIEICADIEFENESGVEPTDVLSIKEKISLQAKQKYPALPNYVGTKYLRLLCKSKY